MNERRRAVAAALAEIEAVLRELELWQAQPPAPPALASREPFCVDTLDFHQWLQFVLLPRLQQLLDSGAPLPGGALIHPMVAEAYRGGGVDTRALEAALERLDHLLG